MANQNDGRWVGRWDVSRNTPTTPKKKDSQRKRRYFGFTSIVAWPLIVLLLQATVLNPLFIEGLLRNLGFGEPPIPTEPEPVLVETSDPVEYLPTPTEATPTPVPTPPVSPTSIPTPTSTSTPSPTSTPSSTPTTATPSPTEDKIPDEIAIDLQDGKEPIANVTQFKIRPGQTKVFILKATNIGNVPLSNIFARAVPSNQLFADTQQGLKVSIWGCGSQWSGTLKDPVCPKGQLSGGNKYQLSDLTNYKDTGIKSGNPQDIKRLFVAYTLPDTADNRYKNQETNITMQLTARRSG